MSGGDVRIFISYSKHDKRLAGDLKRSFEQHKGISCFIAHDDIVPGSPWEAEILRNLDECHYFMPLQTLNLTNSYWCQQESGICFKQGVKIIPLIPDKDGTAPVGFYGRYQGFQIKTADLDKSIDMLITKYKLKDSAVPVGGGPAAEVQISYRRISLNERLHNYSLDFGVLNRTEVAFDNIIAEIVFPAEFLEKQDWPYDHLKGRLEERNGTKYLILTFNYKGLEERTRHWLFDTYLLPGKTLWILGKDPPVMTALNYYVDDKNFERVSKYEVSWTIFINGKKAVEGKVPFKDLQIF